MSQYLSEAFKKLDFLNEETFSINADGLDDFIKFEEEDEFEDSVAVIDTEAETLDDIQDSYVGKVILDCCVCHSKLYKDVEDVVIEDDIANVNEECPFCYTTDGYKVIGQVASFGEDEVEETEEKESDEKETEESKDEKELKESVKTKYVLEFEQMNGPDTAWLKLPPNPDEFGNGDVDEWFTRNKKEATIFKSLSDAKSAYEDYVVGLPLIGDGMEGNWTFDEVLATIDGSLTESVNNVNVETDDDIINVATDENGKVTVSTEPKETFVDNEEVISPLEPEVQSEINSNVEDGGEIEIDMDEFDEESFDELGESYLKKVYENIDSFKTSNVSFIKDRLVVEGVIKFNSGKSKKTNFIFESREATKSGKVRFIGENKEIARGRKSFTVTGKVDNKKFMSESLNYNYGVKGANGKAQRLYGTVKRGK